MCVIIKYFQYSEYMKNIWKDGRKYDLISNVGNFVSHCTYIYIVLNCFNEAKPSLSFSQWAITFNLYNNVWKGSSHESNESHF